MNTVAEGGTGRASAKVAGDWYDGVQSRRHPAHLMVTADGEAQVVDADRVMLARAPFAELQLSDRLGNTPRDLHFPSGGKFETRDNDAIDALNKTWRGGRGLGWVHWLESHWHAVLLTLVIVAVTTWATVAFGVPAAARAIAHSLPASVTDTAARETLSLMEDRILKPSTLSAAEQQRLRAAFDPVLAAHSDLELEVLFRHWPGVPNAFALPDGTLIFTDALVKLAENDQQLVSILAHEVGHVAHRHSLRSIIQNSMLVVAIALIAGDTSGMADLLFGAPLILTELSYSRHFEREADDFSLEYLAQQGISPHHFADIMERLALAQRCTEVDDDCIAAVNRRQDDNVIWTEDADGLPGFLSTHPATAERIARFREAAGQ